jgi:hypothetical protein
MDGRWCFTSLDCACPDARFIYNLNRKAGPWATQPYGDNRSTTGPVPCDGKDKEEWKEYFLQTVPKKPPLMFALAIDYNQEPAQRAMEGNKWKLVAIGERGHDRKIAGEHVYARLYMKRFPKTGELLPARPAVVGSGGLTCNWCCSFFIYDYGFGSYADALKVIGFNSSYGDGKSMLLSRIPVAKLDKFEFPEKNFSFITKTKLAHYYLSNFVEKFIGDKT